MFVQQFIIMSLAIVSLSHLVVFDSVFNNNYIYFEHAAIIIIMQVSTPVANHSSNSRLAYILGCLVNPQRTCTRGFQ